MEVREHTFLVTGGGSGLGAAVEHIIENEMLNGEVIRLDGGIRMAAR